MVLTGCGELLPAPDDGVPISQIDTEPREAVVEREQHGPQPIGPVIEVARGEVDGEFFSLVAYRTRDGVCMQLMRQRGGGGQCGSLPGEGLAAEFGPFGTLGTGSGEGMPVEVSGVVQDGVTSVWVESVAGRRTEARLIDLEAAEIDAQLFIAFLPEGDTAASVVALDLAGAEIGRFDLVPRGGQNAAPTLAGS